MYKSASYQFGDYEVIIVGRENGPRIEFVPAKGAVLKQIFIGQETIPILDSFENIDDLARNKKFKQAVLFPFPNRLENGCYSFQDNSFAFPINEPERQNALHGFVHDMEFVITALELTNDFGKIELSYSYHGRNEAYPFPFNLHISYQINETGFSMVTLVENTGNGVLPYGFGWHPYFKLTSKASIATKPARVQKVNKRLLPTGEEEIYSFEQRANELSDQLDNAFRINNSELLDIKFGSIQGKTLHLQADESFNFFQVYNPAEDIVAIEPVTCNINALNTGDGLIYLPEGESRTHDIRLTIA